MTKVYDGTTAAPSGFTPTYSVTGFVTGDSAATLTNTGSVFNNAHVANANLVTVSGLALSGITGSNSSVVGDYALSGTSKTVAATITSATLTPSLTNTGVTKVYDGSTTAPAGFTPTYSFSGLVTGDSATLTNTGAAYNSADAATANLITVSGLTLSNINGTGQLGDYVLDANTKSVAAKISSATIQNQAVLPPSNERIVLASTDVNFSPSSEGGLNFTTPEGLADVQTEVGTNVQTPSNGNVNDGFGLVIVGDSSPTETLPISVQKPNRQNAELNSSTQNSEPAAQLASVNESALTPAVQNAASSRETLNYSPRNQSQGAVFGVSCEIGHILA